MRFLTVGNLYPPQSPGGGYELVWQSAVAHLRRQGHSVRVLATDHREAGVGEDSEPDVHRDLGWYWKDNEFPKTTLAERRALERRNLRVLARHLGEFRPDAIAWWSMGGMSLSMIEGARRGGHAAAGFVCDDWMIYGPFHDGWQRTFGRRSRAAVSERLTGIPARLDLAAAGAWVFPSDYVRRKSVERWHLTDTAVVHQGIDHGLFRPAPEREWGWRLAYVGRLDPRKGVDLAVQALTQLPAEASLELIGGGDAEYRCSLEGLAAASGVTERVRFTSQLPRDELPAAYARADAVLFPVRWEEPWGLVPLEAMAVGTPVVATGRGGSGEYLDDGRNCLLFDYDAGPGALARALSRLAEGEDLRRAIRQAGFETSAAMDSGDFDRAVEETLIRVSRERPRGGR